tara:strand:- start:877 stop:1032 length:156 start_codon:yes stop_codon:yes gene_type:complete
MAFLILFVASARTFFIATHFTVLIFDEFLFCTRQAGARRRMVFVPIRPIQV